MACEIERKFLIDLNKLQLPENGVRIEQSYIVRTQQLTLRLRRAGNRYFMTLKGSSNGISRSEFEYEIPGKDYLDMLQEFRSGESLVISKTRYYVPCGNHTWEVDVFDGENSGLAVAEIELQSVDEPFEMPDWVTVEVSDDHRYRNAYLAGHPYRSWQ